jgi:RNA polymerase sigma-70 factor (ECF subfamily)
VSDPERHFAEVFDATYVDLVRFAARRVARHQAEDLAAEAFAVAWRRVADLPSDGGEACAWLFGIARMLVLADHRHGRAFPVQLVADVPVPGHEEARAA